MQLHSPDGAWVVPHKRIVWIPPNQRHSVKTDGLSGSWKVMIPQTYAGFLPEKVSVLRTTPLLLAALDSLPESREAIPATRLRMLTRIIESELRTAEREELGVNLPQSTELQSVTEILLKTPEVPHRIDDWAKAIGMSRRTFTRRFALETGSSFEQWRKHVLLGKGLILLTEGKGVCEVADVLGYASPSAFIVAFRRRYGVSPRKYVR